MPGLEAARPGTCCELEGWRIVDTLVRMKQNQAGRAQHEIEYGIAKKEGEKIFSKYELSQALLV